MKSLANRIALKFSLVIAFLVVCVSVAMIALLRKNIRLRESRELTDGASLIANMVLSENESTLLPSEASISESEDIPYYLTYTVYDSSTQKVIATNDPFLPVLPLTQEKVRRYTKKDFYTDGDLNILYNAKTYGSENQVVVQTALNMDQDTAEQLLGYLPRTLVLIFIPLLLISYAAAFLIARQTLKPVSQMTKEAQKITSAHLNASLPVTKHHDELDTLAVTFNDLFAKLKVDFDRERAFTGNVSHELKTPIAVILGQANLIRRWGKDDPQQLEASLSSLISEAHSMESVVTNLLQLSRLESGTIKPQNTKVTLVDLLERLQRDTHAWSPDVVFSVDGVDQTLSLTTDADLLYQCMTIIVSNSVKFSPVPAHITIVAENDSSNKVVSVSFTDDGPGFSPEVLPHVFERFYRGDSSHTRSAGGAGLGLSIAEQLVHVLGGTIAAASLTSPKQGAVVTVAVPVVE